MGQLLRGSAGTTAAVRRALPQRQASRAKLAQRSDVTPKTGAKWKKRSRVHEAPLGPRQRPSTVLTRAEEAPSMAFRRHT